MRNNSHFDVIIIGGSYSGLSAAMALGRALRKVLIIDSGNPCNMQTPHSHNFITHDGETPAQISELAKQQVEAYKTVQFHSGIAVNGSKSSNFFEIKTFEEKKFTAKKLIVASGLKDNMPDIKGFAECWGISVIHCPYCHGYEVRNEKTGVLANGEGAFEMVKMISNWTKELVLFTNGKSTLTKEQAEKIRKHQVEIIETAISEIEHDNGGIQNVRLKNGSKIAVKALYARPPFAQHCDIPETLGCELTPQGLIKVDGTMKTTVPGVWASGDSSSMRSVATAVYTGSMAGVAVNRELTEEEFG